MKKFIFLSLFIIILLFTFTGCNFTKSLCPHNLGDNEILEGKSATCTEGGLSEGKKCALCGKILVAQEEIAPLCHRYDYITENDENGNRVNLAVCNREGCKEVKTVTDKERLIGEWRNASGIFEDDINILVEGLIHECSLSKWSVLTLSVSNGDIYLFNKQHLYEVQFVTDYSCSYDYMWLGNSDKIINGEKVSETLKKLQACKSGYLLETQEDANYTKLFVTKIDNYFYFMIIYDYDNEPVYHIHYTDFSEVNK